MKYNSKIPTNFNAADTFIGAKASRVVRGKRATEVVRVSPDTIALTYHKSPVVVWSRSGYVTLNSYGYRTRTTKERINAATPVRVWQKNGEWYVSEPGERPTPFFDGYTLVAKG